MHHSSRVPRRRLLQGAAALALGAAGAPLRAAEGGLPNAAHGDSSPQWDRLRQRLFGSREVQATSGLVRVQAPLRAAYGASVPLRLAAMPSAAGAAVRRLYVVIDKNPSPLAATIELGPAAGPAEFDMRLRVDEYSHVRVVSELVDGTLHTDSRYVKTSGGCSAPPNREALHLIGKTVLTLAAPPAPGGLATADVTVIHPNDTGFELNQTTVMFIPSHFVRGIRVSFDGRLVFDAELDFSISENPTLRFRFQAPNPGELRAEVVDSRDGHFVGTLAVGPKAAT